MPKQFSGLGHFASRARQAIAGICLSLLALLSLESSSNAQLLSADQLQQLQQQTQQRQIQSEPFTNNNNPQNVILQPAVPQTQISSQRQSRLEQIVSARAGIRLEQFGYDQLGHGQQVVVPLTGAVQDDYVLGPGDEIVVSMRGQENAEFRATVNRNGQIVLPRLPPIPASGRTFGSFREDLDAAVHRAYVGTEASVSVGRLRQISVLVSGEVNQPGERLLTGLSSPVDAILLSGGVRKTGSLRNIRLIRHGHEYMVDLYNVLTNSGKSSILRLADGDQILVMPLGHTVAITGLVRRPGIFELAPHTSSISTRALLELAGGREVRGSYRLSLLHIQPDGTNRMIALSNESGEVTDGDILFVQLNADKVTSVASLSGGTGLAGTYPIIAGSRLSEILKEPGALGSSPYTPFGIVVRKDSLTKMPTLIAITPVAVLSGQEDEYLKGDDTIRIFSTDEIRLLQYIVHSYLSNLALREAAVRDPLSQSSNVASSVVGRLNGMTSQNADEIDSFSSVPSNIQRAEVTALLEVAAPDSRLAREQNEQLRLIQMQRQTQSSSQQINSTQLGTFPRQANQGISVQSNLQPSTQEAASLTGQDTSSVSGQVGTEELAQLNTNSGSMVQMAQPGAQSDNFRSEQNFPISEDVNHLPQNFMIQDVREGRIAPNLEVQTFGQLARQLDVDPLILINFLAEHRVRLDGAVNGPGYYFVGPNASLNDVVQAAGGTVNWADESGVELISVGVDTKSGTATSKLLSLPLHQGALASYVVRPGDIFRFHQVFTDIVAGSVTLQGEVRYPGTYPILRGEHLSDLLARAGGLTSVAYPNGTVFLRQSAARLEHENFIRAADEIQNQLVVAMTRIGSSKIDPNTFTSMQSFVTELRNQQALGRISIVADPSILAANPSLDTLIESGDVIYVPPRPSTVAVLGQVEQAGSYPFRSDETVGDYINRAGGYSSIADEENTFIVMPDGSARKVDSSWLSFQTNKLVPGSAIVVPRDVTPLDLRQTIIDVSQIFSQLAVSIASVAVLSKQ